MQTLYARMTYTVVLYTVYKLICSTVEEESFQTPLKFYLISIIVVKYLPDFVVCVSQVLAA